MMPEEARLAAHICGDGCLSTWIEKNSLQIVNGRRYHQKRRRYEIIYSNNEVLLLNQFSRDLKKVFGVKPRIYKDEVRTKSKRIFEHLQGLGGGGSYDWSISKKIMGASKAIKAEWVTAFFDDEGTVDRKQHRVRIRSMNSKGLASVRKLLKDLKINSSLTGPNADSSWWLTVSRENAVKFAKIIKSKHKTKKKLLKQLIKQRRI